MSNLYRPPLLYLPRFRELLAEATLRATISGKYKVQVCRNGIVIREPFGDRWIPNLITNYGLDQMVSTATFVQSFMNYARIGTGTTPPTNADTVLVAQTQSTNTRGSSNTASTVNDTTNGAATHTEIYEFSAVGSTTTLSELGLSNAASGSSLCTRSLFPSPVTLNTGDNLRLLYALTWSIPCSVTPVTVSLAAVNGFNISGSLKAVGTFTNLFGSLNANGTWNGDNWPGYFCGSAGTAQLGSAPTTFPTVNSNLTFTACTGQTAVTGSLGSYTAGSFSRNQTFTWVNTNPTGTVANVNNILIYTGTTQAGILLILSAVQTKANTNTLTVTYNTTVARV